MRRNIKIVVAYDGTSYQGWQKSELNSIEGELQKALETALQHPIYLQAASRTDAGVHARGQVVNFLTSQTFDDARLKFSLNSMLPKAISILSLEEVDPLFHPTLDCTGKEYRYYICYGKYQLPIFRCYSWHYPAELDFDKMREASKWMQGEHDFTSFCNVKNLLSYEDCVRRVDSIDIDIVGEQRLCIRITGNHFLYKMARIIAGTLAYVGRGKIAPENVKEILMLRDRKQAGITAPAHGLFLHEVRYG